MNHIPDKGEGELTGVAGVDEKLFPGGSAEYIWKWKDGWLI